MPDAPLPALLAALCRAMLQEQRQTAVSSGLLPVQQAILSYLRDANRYSNTQLALTEFLGLTKGTVSQSLNVLEAKGWVRRQNDGQDRRITRLALTDSGRQRLDDAAEQAWAAAASQLDVEEAAAATRLLSRLLASWQRTRQGKTFGVCASCRHFSGAAPHHRCLLTGEALSVDDSRLICREHTAA